MEIELLKKVQEKQIEIMDIIHGICVSEGISYYIIGGTALGAVRHKGFIPWDVDIDIAMPRKDYERFIALAEDLLPKGYTCYHYRKEKDYFPPHALVAVDNSQLIQKDDYLNPTLKRYGVFVDIFPLDIAPEDEAEREKQAKRIKLIRSLKQYKKGILYTENSAFIRLVKKLVSILLCIVPMKSLNCLLDKTMRLYSCEEDNSCWCSMASHYSYKKQCMSKEIYGAPTLVEFTSREYYAPEKLDEYLTRIFKDYMKLPDEKQRQYMIDYFIDAKW